MRTGGIKDRLREFKSKGAKSDKSVDSLSDVSTPFEKKENNTRNTNNKERPTYHYQRSPFHTRTFSTPSPNNQSKNSKLQEIKKKYDMINLPGGEILKLVSSPRQSSGMMSPSQGVEYGRTPSNAASPGGQKMDYSYIMKNINCKGKKRKYDMAPGVLQRLLDDTEKRQERKATYNQPIRIKMPGEGWALRGSPSPGELGRESNPIARGYHRQKPPKVPVPPLIVDSGAAASPSLEARLRHESPPSTICPSGSRDEKKMITMLIKGGNTSSKISSFSIGKDAKDNEGKSLDAEQRSSNLLKYIKEGRSSGLSGEDGQPLPVVEEIKVFEDCPSSNLFVHTHRRGESDKFSSRKLPLRISDKVNEEYNYNRHQGNNLNLIRTPPDASRNTVNSKEYCKNLDYVAQMYDVKVDTLLKEGLRLKADVANRGFKLCGRNLSPNRVSPSNNKYTSTLKGSPSAYKGTVLQGILSPRYTANGNKS